MKDFFKMFFAALLALMCAGAACVMLFFVFVGALAALSKPEPVVRDGSILVFDLSVNIQDRPVDLTGQELIGEALGQMGQRNLSLRSVTEALREAGKDDRIKGVLLTGSFQPSGYGTGFAALKDVRRALLDFRQSGKPVWAHLVYPSSRDLYVASVADRVFMNPEGIVADLGMSMTAPYLGSFLEKYGVGVQVTRAGEYKAAAETFALESMSDPAREANQALLDDIWHDYLNTVTEGSRVSPAEYESLLNAEGIISSAKAQEIGLVDDLAFYNGVIEALQTIVDADEEGAYFRHTRLADYIKAKVYPRSARGGYVAVVYAEGSIVDGEGELNQVGGDRLARVIRQARSDETAKALVLRVNSPGGSALASEVIQNELRLAQERMPVVVSMGSMAASGGYWISAYGDRIFAQPNTITGSIGVIGIFFNIQELAQRHGVNFDGVKTTRFADVMSWARPKTSEEMAVIQKQVDAVYSSFLNKVAEGRSLPVEDVRSLAEGRVWSGADALERGLVDELGGLSEAIAYAGEQAGLGSTPPIRELPKPVNFLEQLLGGLGAQETASAGVASVEAVRQLYRELTAFSAQFNDPRGVYSVLPYTITID